MVYEETTFGAVLKRKRLERGLTQRELADRAGIDASYISQLERDHKFPAAKTLEGLAAALDIGAGELLVMYFPPGEETPYYPAIVGRESQTEAFAAALENDAPGIITYYAPRGYGKTYLIRHKLIPLCREEGAQFFYCNGNRIPGYRDFLAALRGRFAAGGVSYKGFDDIFGQCEQIEERLRSRYNDPFSIPVRTGDDETGEPFELSYAEKYIYRDMERLLTEEFINGFSVYLESGGKTVVFVNEFDRLSLLSEYWLRVLARRLHELGLLGPKLLFVFAGGKPFAADFATGVNTSFELPAFDDKAAADYYAARGINLTVEDRATVKLLEGHPYSIAAWGDYFEAKGYFNNNDLGKAEDILYKLSAELSSRDGYDGIRQGQMLYLELNRRLGRLTHTQGRLAQADEYYSVAERTLSELGEVFEDQLGYVLLDIGTVNRHRGRWQTALGYFERAEVIFDRIGDDLGGAISRLGAGTTLRLLRSFNKAVAEYNRAIKMLTGLKDDLVASQWLASTLSNLSIIRRLEAIDLRKAGSAVEADRILGKAELLCEQAISAGNGSAEAAVAMNRLALCLQVRGQWRQTAGDNDDADAAFTRALDLHKQALTTFESVGDKYRVAQVEFDIGLIDKVRGLRYDAVIHFKNSLAYFQQLGSKYHCAKVLLQLGLLSEGEERFSYLGEAIYVAGSLNNETLMEVVSTIYEELESNKKEREGFFGRQNSGVYTIYEEIGKDNRTARNI